MFFWVFHLISDCIVRGGACACQGIGVDLSGAKKDSEIALGLQGDGDCVVDQAAAAEAHSKK